MGSCGHGSSAISLRRRLVKLFTERARIIAKTLIFFNALTKSLLEIHIDHVLLAINHFSLLLFHRCLLVKGLTIVRLPGPMLILVSLQAVKQRG